MFYNLQSHYAIIPTNALCIIIVGIPIGTNTLKLYDKYHLCNLHNFQQLKRNFQQPSNSDISAQNSKMHEKGLLLLWAM